MRLWGPWLIGQAHLATSVSSQAGFLLAGTGIVVPIDAYTFMFAALVTSANGSVDWHVRVRPAPLTPDADAPEWLLRNLATQLRNYAVEWRHVNP